MNFKNKLYYVEFAFNRIVQKIFGLQARTINYKMPSDAQANKLIAEKLDRGVPFSLLRPGNGEYSFVQQYDEFRMFRTKRYTRQRMYLVLRKDESLISKWCEQFEKDLHEADIVAVFALDAVGEQYLLKSYANPDAKFILLSQIESHFYDSRHSWVRHLEGKKVLIISPFVEQIKKQYNRRSLVWGKNEFLPQMEMRYLKSVWYIDENDNGGFASWFDALQYLMDQLEKIDFDVALIGCGPFSTFLASHCKRMGKVGIQYGGALQMLFGIKGARWDNNSFYNKFFNKYWVRASKDNAPKNANLLDDTCYW